MSFHQVPLSDLYGKALQLAAAQGLMPVQDQERLARSLAAVLSELQRYREQKQQVVRTESRRLDDLKPSRTTESRAVAKEPSPPAPSIPNGTSAPQRPKPARSAKDYSLPFGPVPVANLQALGLWMKKSPAR